MSRIPAKTNAFSWPSRADLADCLSVDQVALNRQIKRLKRRAADGKPVDKGQQAMWQRLARSRTVVQARRDQALTLSYDPELPVVAARERIERACADHPVIIVSGETGSGKTTQLPKLCLEGGRGLFGMIGHTQPRRIAARAVAARIAEELGTALGELVGYQVRFDERAGDATRIKLMTDGILLSEIQRDPLLHRYDTLIIDEAHERSLNIDFLLGHLQSILPCRADLKLIITSATIDTGRFAAHFDGAPVVEVSGRSYPVEIRYQAPAAGQTLAEAIADGVDAVQQHGPGDTLVFLPGEREIREAAERLRKRPGKRPLEILPLYARLSLAEQRRVFAPHQGVRVVLATNVAETSLTVPGIRYVVDGGLARISRYSPRSRLQRLPIEAISQASARQRAGRCGRVGPGLCLRLYEEDEFAARPAFTEPEIQRANLAAVILQLQAGGLGDIQNFPFIDPPSNRQVRDGLRVLQMLGAIDGAEKITALGRQLGRLPIDPRLARALHAAHELGVLREATIIAGALSVQDPRVRPPDQQGAADAAHARFADRGSDLLSWLQLWQAYHEQKANGGRSALDKWCRRHFLVSARMREWVAVYSQLRRQLEAEGLRFDDSPGTPEAVHQALLTGFADCIGNRREDQAYQGPHGRRFYIHPGSGLKGRPQWILATEQVETQRVWGRSVAKIEPQWVEQAVPHLIKRQWVNPRWDTQAGRALATEQSRIFGLTLVSDRQVNLDRVDPDQARDVLIEQAIVAGAMRKLPTVIAENAQTIDSARSIESRVRKQGLIADDSAVSDWYRERLPATITTAAALLRWCKKPANAQALRMTDQDLVVTAPEAGALEQYPSTFRLRDTDLAIDYRHDPDHAHDGAALSVPVTLLNRLTAAQVDYAVPGLLGEKIEFLLRQLPKPIRRRLVPVPETARGCLQRLDQTLPLASSLSLALQQCRGVSVAAEDWALDRLPAHLRVTIQVTDADGGKPLDASNDIEALKTKWLAQQLHSVNAAESGRWQREGIQQWDFGELPESVALSSGAEAFPALCRRADGRVDLALMLDAAKAEPMHREGVVGLLQISVRKRLQSLIKQGNGQTAALAFNNLPMCSERQSDAAGNYQQRLAWLICQQAARLPAPAPRNSEAFAQLLSDAKPRLGEATMALSAMMRQLMEERRALLQTIEQLPAPYAEQGRQEHEHLDALVNQALFETPLTWLTELPRYVQAGRMRLERLIHNPSADQRALQAFTPWQQRLPQLVRLADTDDQAQQLRWMIEEYRVSLFAQGLKTRHPVSEKRLQRLLKGLPGLSILEGF